MSLPPLKTMADDGFQFSSAFQQHLDLKEDEFDEELEDDADVAAAGDGAKRAAAFFASLQAAVEDNYDNMEKLEKKMNKQKRKIEQQTAKNFASLGLDLAARSRTNALLIY